LPSEKDFRHEVEAIEQHVHREREDHHGRRERDQVGVSMFVFEVV